MTQGRVNVIFYVKWLRRFLFNSHSLSFSASYISLFIRTFNTKTTNDIEFWQVHTQFKVNNSEKKRLIICFRTEYYFFAYTEIWWLEIIYTFRVVSNSAIIYPINSFACYINQSLTLRLTCAPEQYGGLEAVLNLLPM